MAEASWFRVRAKVQIDVGSQGLVQNGTIGFETFEKNASAIGMTDNEFEVKYVNALNGEVERLLEKMQGVQDATVLLNLPKESVFAKRKRRSSQRFRSCAIQTRLPA